MKHLVLLLISLIVLTFPSDVLALIPADGCIPSTVACSTVYSTNWEYDASKNICYQPFAQCGGSQYSTQAECEKNCVATPLQLTPIVTQPAQVSPIPLPDPSCPKSNGDANGDGKVSLLDYEIFRESFTVGKYDENADFNCDNVLSLLDFELFRIRFLPVIF